MWRELRMSIEKEIRQFIEGNFILDGKDDLSPEDSLLEKGIIDSTGVLELVAFIEENYSLKIKDEELIPENLDSIKNISRFIQEKLGRVGELQYGSTASLQN
jgi:acyl carrier protein